MHGLSVASFETSLNQSGQLTILRLDLEAHEPSNMYVSMHQLG